MHSGVWKLNTMHSWFCGVKGKTILKGTAKGHEHKDTLGDEDTMYGFSSY